MWRQSVFEEGEAVVTLTTGVVQIGRANVESQAGVCQALPVNANFTLAPAGHLFLEFTGLGVGKRAVVFSS